MFLQDSFLAICALKAIIMLKSIKWGHHPPRYTIHPETLLIFSLSKTTGFDVRETINVWLRPRDKKCFFNSLWL